MLITSAPYFDPIQTHNFNVKNSTTYNFLVDVIDNKNIEKLNDFLDSGGSLSSPVSWEFAISISNSQGINFGSSSMHGIFFGEATVLHVLVYYSDNNIIQSLINHHIDFNEYGYFTGSYNGYRPIDGTPLHMLMQYKDNEADLLELMLDNGASLNILNSFGETPLQSAKRVKNAEMVNFLEEYIQTHDLSDQPSITFAEYTEAKLALKNAEIIEGDIEPKEYIDSKNNTTSVEFDIEMTNHTETKTNPISEVAIEVPQSWSQWAAELLNPSNWFQSKSSPEIKLTEVLKTANDIDFDMLPKLENAESQLEVLDNNTTVLQAYVPQQEQDTFFIAQELA